MRFLQHAKWILVLVAALVIVGDIFEDIGAFHTHAPLGIATVAPTVVPNRVRNEPTPTLAVDVADNTAVPVPLPDPAPDEPTHIVADKASIDAVVTANGDFAADLYARLALENPGRNIFFSPYSLSIVLAMAAEGARGETAEQMGKALRFPEAARHRGAESNELPWNMEMIHTGIAGLSDQFGRKAISGDLANRVAIVRAEIADAEKKRKQDENERARALSATNPEDRLDFNTGLSPSDSSYPTPTQRLNQLMIEANPYELRTANSLWCDSSYPLQQSFVDIVRKYYRASGVFSVDFGNDLTGARQRVNDWISGQTNRRIENAIPPNALDEYTRLILINTIYFHGEWEEPFLEENTRNDDFILGDYKKVWVHMMHELEMTKARYAGFNADGTLFPTPDNVSSSQARDEKLLYPDKDGFIMAELPYKGDDLSMLLIVPRDANGLTQLERKLSNPTLQTWIGKLKHRPKLDVAMPKFRLETTYDMNNTLQALGMIRAFAHHRDLTDGAQFDGICSSKDPMFRLYIKEVVHKAYVDVNERGTEAAASSVLALDVDAAADVEPFTPVFRADKPFIFAIRDIKTGTILFLGRIMNPKE